jgi:peroxiredoxin family protein
MSQKHRFIIFAHNSSYDALHQVATLGLTAAAMGRQVTVVLMFWAIKKLSDGRLDELDFSPEHHVDGQEVARLLKEKKVPKISEMFAEARQVGHFHVVACSAGLEYMGVDEGVVKKNVDEVLGLPAILNLTAGAETTLFI